MVRLNITIPEDLVKELNHIRNKSRFISEALREKFTRQKKQKLESILIEGYQRVAQEDRKVNQEWESASLDE